MKLHNEVVAEQLPPLVSPGQAHRYNKTFNTFYSLHCIINPKVIIIKKNLPTFQNKHGQILKLYLWGYIATEMGSVNCPLMQSMVDSAPLMA